MEEAEQNPFAGSEHRLYSPLLESALRLAARGHYRQFRKGGAPDCARDGPLLPATCVPYVTHLMGTACILARLGAPDTVLAAALLHDFLEDVPAPDGEAVILEAAGPEVLEIVRAVTENKRRDEEASATWEVRKREQLEGLDSIPVDAVLVKAADALHNLLSLLGDLAASERVDAVWGRFNAAPQRQMWYYRGLAERIGERLGDHPLARELAGAVKLLNRWVLRKH